MKYKIKNITPEDMQCLAMACPAIYKVETNCAAAMCKSYAIVGKQVDPKEVKDKTGKSLADRVGKGEALIVIPEDVFKNFKD